MRRVVISGTGFHAPAPRISNEELVAAFNAYVRRHNAEHAGEIEAGTRQPLAESSAEFIEKASGIRCRHVVDKAGLLDPERLVPSIAERGDDQICVQAELAVAARAEHWRRPAARRPISTP